MIRFSSTKQISMTLVKKYILKPYKNTVSIDRFLFIFQHLFNNVKDINNYINILQ